MGRISDSASLYLRQHADDPVDWRPWGDEAFAEAAATGKPVFLSVGYSSCHWCHVMQRESFRDDETAAFLNERFVPIKVDREQRPDVDAVYMDYVASSTGSAGWPMSVFLTAERLPVFGGSYLPKERMERLPSFMDVLTEVETEFREAGERLGHTADAATGFLQQMAAPPQAGDIDGSTVSDAAHVLLMSWDSVNGGFGRAPKFPRFSVLLFLAEFTRHRTDREVLHVVGRTMEAMLQGGIFDQAGGGMCRYAVDEAWTVPHFEKMLPDNALLLRALAAAQTIAPSAEWERAARATMGWLEREMSLPSGAYASALSADTEGVEGATYLWTRDDLEAALGSEGLGLAERVLGTSGDTHVGDAYVLRRPLGLGQDDAEVDALLARLLEARSKRPQPERDDKAVVSWNAIAARGLIEAGRAFGDEAATARGVELARMLAERCADGVVHVLDDPSVAHVRLAEDHAHLAAALLTAHEATGDETLLAEAERIHAESVSLFVDDDVVWMTPAVTDLPVRPREQQDEPMPSGASTVAENAVRLSSITGDGAHRELAGRLLPGHWAAADSAPHSVATALAAMLGYLRE